MFIDRKGINAVHLTKELGGRRLLSSYQIGNISHLRFHGLVAKIKNEPGNYCITNKGFDFLKGETINKTAIIKKGTKGASPHNIGYGDEKCKISDFDKKWINFWESSCYIIKQGRVIKASEYPEEQISI